MSSAELDGLIVDHLADLDQAAIRIMASKQRFSPQWGASEEVGGTA